jgi:hypothetical protein
MYSWPATNITAANAIANIALANWLTSFISPQTLERSAFCEEEHPSGTLVPPTYHFFPTNWVSSTGKETWAEHPHEHCCDKEPIVCAEGYERSETLWSKK